MVSLRGHVVTGLGQGASFTNLEWVVEQIRERLGWRPFPGTVNVRVIDEDRPLLSEAFALKDFDLVSPDPRFCNATIKRVLINRIQGIAVFPGEEVRFHGPEIVEIIAPCSLREEYGLDAGDAVEISVP